MRPMRNGQECLKRGRAPAGTVVQDISTRAFFNIANNAAEFAT